MVFAESYKIGENRYIPMPCIGIVQVAQALLPVQKVEERFVLQRAFGFDRRSDLRMTTVIPHSQDCLRH